jgi:hypothetical protein
VAGDGLKMGSGESADFPTSVKAVVTLVGKSTRRGKVALSTRFESQTD